MILVAGGTGRLGTMLVEHLSADGRAVRVLTRDPARARHLGESAEVVVGDVRDRSSLEEAMSDVTTVVSAVQGFAGPGRVTPESVDNHGNRNLIDLAAADAAHVVLMSVVGASPDSPMELFRAKYVAETYLKASGTRWTIVRATAFAELWAELVGKGVVLGRGDNPINFVSVADVAAAVERAVVDPSLANTTLEIGGSQNLTMNELARLSQQVRCRPRKVRHVPRWLLRAVGPVARLGRAALAMDTIDMTFTPALPTDDRWTSQPTPLADALSL